MIYLFIFRFVWLLNGPCHDQFPFNGNCFMLFCVCKNQSFVLRTPFEFEYFIGISIPEFNELFAFIRCTLYSTYQMGKYLSRTQNGLAFMLYLGHSKLRLCCYHVKCVGSVKFQVMGIGMGMRMRMRIGIWGLMYEVWVFNCWTTILLHRHTTTEWEWMTKNEYI